MTVVDEISPREYGEDRIDLTLSEQTPAPQANDAAILDVGYDRALPEGVTLPLELTITSPTGESVYQRQVFRRFAPNQISFVPREGGSHLVRFAEQHHNRWFGLFVLDVIGTKLTET